MSVSRLARSFDGGAGIAPPIFDTVLERRGLTLIELDPGSERLFVALRRCDPAGLDARATFVAAKRLCRDVYAERYPEYGLDVDEPHDANACLLYSRSRESAISGMLRICFDAEPGLPIEPSLPSELDTLRRCGVRVAEPGRFVIPDGGGLYKSYLRAAYQLARVCGIELYLMQVRVEHADFYRRVCAAARLNSDRAPPGCLNLAWNIAGTPSRFFRAFGVEQRHLNDFLAAQEAGR